MIKENLQLFLIQEKISVRQFCLSLGRSDGWFANTNDKVLEKLLPQIKVLYPSLNINIINTEIKEPQKMVEDYVLLDPEVQKFHEKIGNKNIAKWSFEEYIEGISVYNQASGYKLPERLAVLQVAEYYKVNKIPYRKIDKKIRLALAGGCRYPEIIGFGENIDFDLFGSVPFQKDYKDAVQLDDNEYLYANQNIKGMSDVIGTLLSNDFNECSFGTYINSFNTGNPKALASRGLAIWHPEKYLCLNNANEPKLRDCLEFDKEIEWKDYSLMLQKIYDMEWYKQAQTFQPRNEIEKLCKKYCVALFDCLVYRVKSKTKKKVEE